MLSPPDLLSWNNELGYGFYPVDQKEWPYDEAYRAKYEKMAVLPMAKRLNHHRVSLALYAASLSQKTGNGIATTYIDIGPGDGAFMRELSKALPDGEDFVYGFDVNPAMVQILREDFRYAMPGTATAFEGWNGDDRANIWSVMTFWDSFEHIHRPDKTVTHAISVAMSIPIFRNRAHVLESKHFRPDEHVWYFTHEGIITFMKKCGFKCVSCDEAETKIGREDILSYVFTRD
jgi:SAM-dependent methyltransferase